MTISLQKDKQCRRFDLKTEPWKPWKRNQGKETKKPHSDGASHKEEIEE